MESLRKPSTWGRKTQAIVFAVGVHVLVLVVLGINFDWKPNLVTAGQPRPQPMLATVVPATRVNEELARIEAKEDAKRVEVQQQQQRVEDLIEQAEELEAERQKQEQELARLETKRETEQEQARVEEQQRLARVQQEAEQRKAEEQQRKEEQERLAAEHKRKDEAEQKRLAEERKRKDEAERKRVAEENKRKAEQARQRELAEAKKRKEAEQRRVAEQRRKEEDAVRNRIDAQAALVGNFGAIQGAVSRNWIQPPTFVAGQTAIVRVKVGRAGEVLDARVISGSGDPVFDRSVYNAVLKSSPLPIPRDPRYYEHIREFNIKFNPYG